MNSTQSFLLVEQEQDFHILVKKWNWVMTSAFPRSMLHHEIHQLPSFQLLKHATSGNSTPLLTRTLRLSRFVFELAPPSSDCAPIKTCWGSSSLLDCLRYKDLLVEALAHAGLSWVAPPSLLLPRNPARIADSDPSCQLPDVGRQPEILAASQRIGQSSFIAGRSVLKPPMGCQGKGIEFLGSVSEALPTLARDRKLAKQNRTDEMIQRKKPRWVLQAHIDSLPVRGGRKFHLRVHMIFLETLQAGSKTPVVRAFFHRQHEVRIAADAMREDEDDYHRRAAHITNGAGGNATERRLMDEVEELQPHRRALEEWLACFVPRLVPTLHALSPPSEWVDFPGLSFSSWALTALDVMMDQSLRFWLLEVNRLPAAPALSHLHDNPTFHQHLIKMAQDMPQLLLSESIDHTDFVEI